MEINLIANNCKGHLPRSCLMWTLYIHIKSQRRPNFNASLVVDGN